MSVGNSYQFNPKDLKELVSAFDNIHEKSDFIERHGFDVAIALANLVGQIKDQNEQYEQNNDPGSVLPRRQMDRAFEDKARELEEYRLEELTDATPYCIFETLLDRVYSSTSFIISSNQDDTIGNIVEAVLRVIKDEGPPLPVDPEMKLNIFLSSLSCEEYEMLCFEDIA